MHLKHTVIVPHQELSVPQALCFVICTVAVLQATA